MIYNDLERLGKPCGHNMVGKTLGSRMGAKKVERCSVRIIKNYFKSLFLILFPAPKGFLEGNRD